MKKLAKFTMFSAALAGGAVLFACFAKYLADQNSSLKELLSKGDDSSADVVSDDDISPDDIEESDSDYEEIDIE